MSEVDINNKDKDYLANILFNKKSLTELANSLKTLGRIGPIPYHRLIKLAETLQ